MRADREAEHAVAEEREALVGVRAALAPGGVREDLAQQILGQLVEQLTESRGARVRHLRTRGHEAACGHGGVDQRAHQASPICASTKSAACPTVRISAACSSEMRTE